MHVHDVTCLMGLVGDNVCYCRAAKRPIGHDTRSFATRYPPRAAHAYT